MILIVLVLPEDEDQSVEHTVEQLILRRCAYWTIMTGLAAAETTSYTTVQIPCTQVFSPQQLADLMGRVSREEFRR